jgi:phage portal protein BeeE
LEGYLGNGPIGALINVRMAAFTEARFVFERKASGDVVDDHPRLRILERPWPNGTTADLLAFMELDVSLAGNSYVWRTSDELQRLRPDLVDILWGYRRDGTVALEGYVWWKDGRHRPTAIGLGVDEVAHYKLTPHPFAQFAGSSWIQSVAREVDADARMNIHKDRYYHNAATPNLAIVTESQLSSDQKVALRDMLERRFTGVENAYKTIVLEGGADIKTLAHTMEQQTFTAVQAAGETRLAAAAGVPPVVVGFVQGIQSATYSNYSQAMRRFADLTVRPMWRQAVGALASIVAAPNGSKLWYDTRDVGFLQQDGLDAAQIKSADASTLETLIRSGFEPVSAIEAIQTGRWEQLTHTGLVSVQLQPPGVTVDESASDGEPDATVGDDQDQDT